MNPLPGNFHSAHKAQQPPHWSAQEKRIMAVEAALRSLSQSGGAAHSTLSRLVKELIEDYRAWQEGEIAAMKRAGAVALQCARVLDSMEQRLAAVGPGEESVALSQRFAAELEALRAVAHEHLSSALCQESTRERTRFPLVFLN